MAQIEVKVPVFSESVSEGTLMSWHVKVGDTVARDDVLVEIETDKVVMDVPAATAGVVTEILAQAGEVVQSDRVIARIDTSAKQAKPKAEVAKAEAVKAPETRVQAVQEAPKQEESQKPAVIKNTPPAVLGDRSEERVPMSPLRARVAERLLASQQQTASLTTFNEVNMAAVMAMRKKYQDQFSKTNDIRLGFMSFFVKAAVHALKQYPIVNASIDGQELVYHNYYDIGVAIGSPRGLVVPVIRDADRKSFAEIEQQIADFSARAQDGKLTIEELTGGTFTITNGGVFGSMLSTPIINPPQSAILGIHATKERPVVENGEIVIRPICYLALSYDHRLIDGRDSVLTLVAIKEALEDPARMLIDL